MGLRRPSEMNLGDRQPRQTSSMNINNAHANANGPGHSASHPKLPNSQQVIIEEKSITASRQITTKRYVKGNFLGKGGFAKVYEIRNLELDHL